MVIVRDDGAIRESGKPWFDEAAQWRIAGPRCRRGIVATTGARASLVHDEEVEKKGGFCLMVIKNPESLSPPRGPPRAESDAPPRAAFDFAATPGPDESIGELLRHLIDQGGHLAQQQTALLEAEVRAGVDDIKEAAGAIAGAAVVGVAGLGVLLMGVAFLLGLAMPLWLATMLVALIAMGVAYGMYAAARRTLENSSLKVERTRHTLERAPDAMTGHEGGSNDARTR